MSQEMESREAYSQSRMVWFSKTSGLYQPILAFPIIGFVSTYQALIIFMLGLPSLFITMSVTGQVFYGAIPFALFTLFSMIRPPVLSYEARLLAIVKFYARGGKKAGKKRSKSAKTGRRSSVLAKPSTTLRKPDTPRPVAVEPVPDVVETMVMHVPTGGIIELSITLKNRDKIPLRRHKVRILLDGDLIRVDRSSDVGKVSLTLNYEDCIGTRKVTIEDSVDKETVIAEREITFIR